MDSIRAPVLLIHGRDDWRADYEHALQMKKALGKVGKQMEWLSLKREGHGVSDEETRKEVYERILAFLGRHFRLTALPRRRTLPVKFRD